MKKRRTKENEWAAVILDYLGASCVYCGAEEDLHIHHVIPLYVGGPNRMSNLQVVCNEHHRQLHLAINTVLGPPRNGNTRVVHQLCGTRSQFVEETRISSGKSKRFYCPECNCFFLAY